MIFIDLDLKYSTSVGSITDMEFVGSARHQSFEPQRPEPVSLERFWDEVAWQRRQLEEGDSLVPDPESRCFSVRYRSGGLPAERYEQVTATGTSTLFLKQHQWGEGTGKVGCEGLRRAGAGLPAKTPPSCPTASWPTGWWIWLRRGPASTASIWRRWASWRHALASRAPRTGCGRSTA